MNMIRKGQIEGIGKGDIRERKRILLVEDEEDAKESVALILAEYTLTCARNFDEGLLAARRE